MRKILKKRKKEEENIKAPKSKQNKEEYPNPIYNSIIDSVNIGITDLNLCKSVFIRTQSSI